MTTPRSWKSQNDFGAKALRDPVFPALTRTTVLVSVEPVQNGLPKSGLLTLQILRLQNTDSTQRRSLVCTGRSRPSNLCNIIMLHSESNAGTFFLGNLNNAYYQMVVRSLDGSLGPR